MSSTTLTTMVSSPHPPVHMSSSSASCAATAAMIPSPAVPPTGTSTSSSLKQSPLKNKRCSSSSSLDCQSLQSSLKRVRLSCSPGELRLQKDLRCLPALGWIPETDLQDDYMMDSPMGSGGSGSGHHGSTSSTASSTLSRPFALDSNPRWVLQSTNVAAELQLLDPLRLVLSVQRPQRCSRLWIQIPRMYPHRPPVISRMENMAMEQIVVMEEPPGMPHGQETASGSTLGTTVVYYKEWSPVRHLGDLLGFLLQASATPTTSFSRSSSFTTSVASTGSVDGGSSHLTSSMTTEVSLASSTAASVSSTSSPNEVSSSATTIQRRHASPSQFMDEHKMDDVFVCYKTKVWECNNNDMAVQVLAPNRFDVGYGKYCNPFEFQQRKSLEQQNNDPNAMEL